MIKTMASGKMHSGKPKGGESLKCPVCGNGRAKKIKETIKTTVLIGKVYFGHKFKLKVPVSQHLEQGKCTNRDCGIGFDIKDIFQEV